MKALLAQVESCCVYVKAQKITEHMHGIIPFMFYCWADPVVHLYYRRPVASDTKVIEPS